MTTTTTFLGDNPIAQAARAHQAQLDWVNAANKVNRLRAQLAKAQDEYDLAFQRYTGVDMRGATNG